MTLNKSIKETNKIAYNKSYIKTKHFSEEKYITGGEALYLLLKKIKLKKKIKEINKSIFNIEKNEKKINLESTKKILTKYKKRLILINYFMLTKSNPSWMTLKYLPVLPPNIRPIVRLQDRTIITTDLNFLYSNIINSNNKIIKLRKMSVPEIFLNNEKNILQDKIDKLINNEKKTYNLSKKSSKKKLKSLTQSIQGKKGRFRENLLGKTVDYSGRSVIVVEPKLNLKECGIPKEMAIELFQPFLIKKMFKLKVIYSLREGKKKIFEKNKILEKLLNKIIENHCILLNRAPTLHRVGVQAFIPILNDEKAIQLHPLVCSAFNADFDGDQMGIHIPLTLKAQAEARSLMISSNNFSSPATGQTNITPSQDMILGSYFLTIENGSLVYILKKIKSFVKMEKIFLEYKKKQIEIHDYIWIYFNKNNDKRNFIKIKENSNIIKKIKFIRTTTGRVIFNNAIVKFL